MDSQSHTQVVMSIESQIAFVDRKIARNDSLGIQRTNKVRDNIYVNIYSIKKIKGVPSFKIAETEWGWKLDDTLISSKFQPAKER